MARRNGNSASSARGTRGNSSRAGFQYKKRDKAAVQKRADQQAGDFKSIFKEGIKLFKPKAGDNAIRILPATWEDAEHYAFDVNIHYQVGVDEERVVALHEMLGEPDPIHEMRLDYEADGNKDMAKACRPGRQCAMFVIDLDNEAEGVQLYLAPPTVDAGIAQVSIDKRSGEMFDIDDPDNGYDVYFTKQGKGMSTKYVGFQLSRNTSQLDEEFLDYAIENPIPDAIVYLEYDEVAKMIEGWTPKPKNWGDNDKKDDKKGKTYRGRDRDRNDNDDANTGNSDAGDGRSEGDYNFDDVMAADWEELEEIIDIEQLDIDATAYNDDEVEACAADILAALGIEKPKPKRSGRVGRGNSDAGKSEGGKVTRRQRR